jgi:hypothetical protein
MVYVTRSVMAVCIYTERYEYQRNVLQLSAEGFFRCSSVLLHRIEAFW